MPNEPTSGTTLTNDSVKILNAIRNSSSANYKNFVPKATNNVDSLRAIGDVIMSYDGVRNEFLDALINRIGLTIVTGKMFSNPWSCFKRGLIDYGETIEEIFVAIAEPFEYSPETAGQKNFARNIPDVKSAFYSINYKKFYKVTVSDKELRQAFLSFSGLNELITRIINSVYSAANYDEFITMKYMIAKQILNGRLHPVEISTPNAQNAKSITAKIKSTSNNFVFMNNQYNIAGVENFCEKSDQYLIVNSDFDAIMDVEVLATAFNMDKSEFMGHKILIDGFGNIDNDRLSKLFANDETFTAFTDDEKNALNTIPAVIVDKNFLLIYDNIIEFTSDYVGEGMYWNYWLHNWKTFGVSPFANNSVFVVGAPSVTSVTVSPKTVTTSAGQTVSINADVKTENFCSQAVNWSVSNSDYATVDVFGNVSIKPSTPKTTTITVTAKSDFNDTKSDSCVITVN